MATAPAVSVVMAFYNGETYFQTAIESVLNQTFGDFEVLVCDDGSTPDQTALVHTWAAKDARIRYLNHPGHANKGASLSRDLGLASARGEFFTLIDQDDRWRPDKLAEQLEIMRTHPDVGLVCGAVNYWKSWAGEEDEVILCGHVLNTVVPPPEAFINVYPLGWSPAPTPSDVMFRRSALEAVGGFEASFSGPYALYEDQSFFTKLYLAHPVWFSDRTWLDYRQHPELVMATAIREGRYDLARAHFLGWLERYLAAHPELATWPVKIALDSALGPYRPSLSFKLARRLRQVAARFA